MSRSPSSQSGVAFGAKIIAEDSQWYLQHLENEVRQLRELLGKGNWRELEDRLPHLMRGGRCYGFAEVSEQGRLAVEACLKQDRKGLEAALTACNRLGTLEVDLPD